MLYQHNKCLNKVEKSFSYKFINIDITCVAASMTPIDNRRALNRYQRAPHLYATHTMNLYCIHTVLTLRRTHSTEIQAYTTRYVACGTTRYVSCGLSMLSHVVRGPILRRPLKFTFRLHLFDIRFLGFISYIDI